MRPALQTVRWATYLKNQYDLCGTREHRGRNAQSRTESAYHFDRESTRETVWTWGESVDPLPATIKIQWALVGATKTTAAGGCVAETETNV